MSEKFKELIAKASMSPNDKERNESEQQLFEIMNRDYQNFFYECMKIFLDDKNDRGLRLATSTMMTIAAKESKVMGS